MYRFLILLFTLIGCAPVVEFPTTIDVNSDWDEEHLEVVTQAFDTWKKVSGGIAKVDLVWKNNNFEFDRDYMSDNTVSVYAVHEDNQGLKELLKRAEHDDFLAITRTAMTIVVREDKTKKLHNLYRLMLHEIGHLYGIREHSENPRSIMYPFQNKAMKACIDEETLEKFCDLYPCTLAAKSDCEE